MKIAATQSERSQEPRSQGPSSQGPRRLRPRRGRGARAMLALDRSARTPRLIDGPADVAAILSTLRIVVVGVGSVGLSLADVAARMGVGELILVDRGVFKPESVLTHPVHPDDIGRPKATVAGERAKAIAPSTTVTVFDGAIEELSLADVAGASVVLLASDNIACELEVARLCSRLGLPCIQASLHGGTLVASVRALANQPGEEGPCLACTFQSGDWKALDEGTLFSCTGTDSRAAAPVPSGVPTVSPPALCAIAANLAIMELYGLALGLRPADTNRVVEYCGHGHRVLTTELVRRADCRLDHEPWGQVPVRRAPGATKLGRLVELAGYTPDTELDACSVEVEGVCFTRVGSCGCPSHPLLDRFQPLSPEAAVCQACGQALVAHPFYTHQEVPGQVLRDHLGRTLAELGAPDARAVTVRGPRGPVLIYGPTPGPSRPQPSPKEA